MNSEKQKIYYARTYRHLTIEKKKTILYFALWVVPVFFVVILNLSFILDVVTEIGVQILSSALATTSIYIVKEKVPILGVISYVDMPTTYPDFSFVFINFLVSLFFFILSSTGRRKGKPIAIYFSLCFVVHMVNSLYFIFAPETFPYTMLDYSELYVKQQIGIWIVSIILAGLVTGFLGGRAYIYKIFIFTCIVLYSLIFGSVRYLLFLYVLYQYSVLYMAIMFFVFGPLFDFMYMVAIYSMLVNRMIKTYDEKRGRGDWKWS